MAGAGWPVFEDRQHGFVLSRPPNWKVLTDSPNQIVIQDQGLQAELAIEFLDGDCAAAQENLRARRPNYYLIREFTREIAGAETSALEFRDTIANAQEIHAFFPVERRCCHVRSRRPAGPKGLEFDSILESMISTLRFPTDRRV